VRILVTGAAGFIGSQLCARLVAEGHRVVGLDNLSDGSVENLRDVSEMELVEADLRDEESVRNVARGCEVVLHQGAVRSVPRSIESPQLTTEVNVRGTLNVLLAARDQQARVVFASSSSVYGDQRTFPLHEGLSPRPGSPYAASKVAGEAYCQASWKAFGVQSLSLRYFNVYGPRQNPSSEYAAVVPRFIVACLTGTRPVIHGDGQQARDFTFIDDAVQANILAARAPDRAWGGVFNVGGGARPTSIEEVLALIAELTASNPDPLYSAPRVGDVRLTQADVSLARSALGYRPGTSIRDGLRLTVDWFRYVGLTRS
jgi:nucleoside-diphosphate-sugar epimerase